MLKIAVFVILLAVVYSSCGPAPPAESPVRRMLSDDERENIVRVADRFTGIPYRYSGRSGSGFDCSGFVNRVFDEAVGLQLPRTTRELYQYSRPIHFEKAMPGDLIFFSTKMNGRADHVAIYAGGDEFYHASKTNGVCKSSLAEDYYLRRLFGFRRLKLELLPRTIYRTENQKR